MYVYDNFIGCRIRIEIVSTQMGISQISGIVSSNGYILDPVVKKRGVSGITTMEIMAGMRWALTWGIEKGRVWINLHSSGVPSNAKIALFVNEQFKFNLGDSVSLYDLLG